MRRRLARPYGHSVPPSRGLSLLMALVVIIMLYQRVKEPHFWYWLTNESRADSVDVDESVKPKALLPTPNSSLPISENLVPGPNETDADELAKMQSNFKAVQDRQPLQSYEMSAYWQLMRWSRTRPFAELEKLARRDVWYQHLWDEPNLFRGLPIRLKLHVRRVQKFEPSKNPQDLKVVYEAWGWTDDSRSFPFCVVFPDKPDGLPIGTDVEADVVFVGYFLKWMSYQGFDGKKNSPLLIGRLRPVGRAGGVTKTGGWESAFLTLIGGVLVLSFFGWFAIYGLRRPRTIIAATTAIPDQLPANWISGSADDSPALPTAERLNFESTTPANAGAIASLPIVTSSATTSESAPLGMS